MSSKERLVDLRHTVRQDADVCHAEYVARSMHQQNVEFFRATPEEIEEWYFAKDPTDTASWLITEVAASQGDSKQLSRLAEQAIQDRITLGRGGLALLAHEIFHDVAPNTETDYRWFTRLDEQYYQQNAELGLVPPGEMTANTLLDLCELAVESPELAFTPSQLPRVYLAAEMLRASNIDIIQSRNLNLIAFTELEGEEAKQWAEQHFKGDEKMPSVLITGISDENMKEFIRKQNVISDRLLAMLGAYSVIEVGEEHQEYTTDSIKMLGLKAFTQYVSTWMSDLLEGSCTNKPEEVQGVAFSKLVFAMQNVFGELSKPITQRLRSPEVKGSLHEILWFMDGFVLRHIESEKYGNVRTSPVFSRNDAPRIGYPEQRRGFDMYVTCGDILDHIQLKSSPNKHNGHKVRTISDDAMAQLPADLRNHPWEDEDYHPMIIKLHEPNFLETNPRRLIAKLNAYQRWIDSGFDAELGNGLHKYVMTTVAEEFDAVSRRQIDRGTQLKHAIRQYVIEPGVRAAAPDKSPSANEPSGIASQRKAARKAVKQARRKQRR